MAKSDAWKIVVSIAVIVVLAVVIVNVNKIISPTITNTIQEKVTTTNVRSVTNYGECFSKSLDTIVFVYSNSCPYCNRMKPIIEELEEEGYKFYWAEGSDIEAREIISTCFSDLMSGYVPQFICPANGGEQTGAMSKEDLKKFADNCVSSKI